MENTIKKSKYLSLILRHNPDAAGIKLDNQGWTNVSILLEKVKMDIKTLEYVVENNDKKRFEFNGDKTQIRASQGHSIEVELEYKPIEPPDFLYHGTIGANIQSIKKSGLLKGSRHHVHLSADVETAKRVGGRRGVPVILTVRTGDMFRAGHKFYQSTNGVWLTEHVPTEFID